MCDGRDSDQAGHEVGVHSVTLQRPVDCSIVMATAMGRSDAVARSERESKLESCAAGVYK